MITSVKQAQALAKEYNALKTDKERYAFLKAYPDSLMVQLDNDCTMVKFNMISVDDDVQEEAIENIELNDFDEYHGWSDGNIELFKFAGISAESC